MKRNASMVIVRAKEFGENEIRFYGHFSGTDNVQAVLNVLGRTVKLGDASYFTAQLFYEFALNLGEYDGELSFGICSSEVGENPLMTDCPTVYVNADYGHFEYDGKTYSAADAGYWHKRNEDYGGYWEDFNRPDDDDLNS